MSLQRREHREFLNRYYGISRHFYDITRAYYLLGRDRALDQLLEERWDSLIEVGPGTGRNLRRLRRLRTWARLGGVEASDAMLEHAQRRCPWAALRHGFAEDVEYHELFGHAPDRILFSYCLSMVGDPWRALDNARRALSCSGQVVVVDFADLSGLKPPFERSLRKWLRTFHVEPLDLDLLEPRARSIERGPGGHYLIARYDAL